MSVTLLEINSTQCSLLYFCHAFYNLHWLKLFIAIAWRRRRMGRSNEAQAVLVLTARGNNKRTTGNKGA